MGETIHHKYFSSDICPCKALERHIHHILANGGSTESYISDHRDTNKDPFAPITPTSLITSIKLHHTGINPDLVVVHSLRIGGGGRPQSYTVPGVLEQSTNLIYRK